MKFKTLPVILTAALTSVSTLFIAAQFQNGLPFTTKQQRLPVNYAKYSTSDMVHAAPPADFENAAEASVQAVVHIKTQTAARQVVIADDFFGGMFPRQGYIPPQQGSGSGVVISPDGYIVTNNHVIAGAEKVTVTFNDRYTKDATVISKDPSTDLAILKVEDKNLPYMEFGNSDDVKLGQWVLAVGYPLTLDATVTAGIVSAKSRAIGINRQQSASAIESFIQTDAAVNPGNSGGALVNANGQLIGINSAIASPTGSYAGYSYAIPANIVKKVTGDLIKYGTVQRAYLGVQLLERNRLSEAQIAKLGINKEDGVYAAAVVENSGAAKAGLKAGDFITKINNAEVRTEPQLLEQIARYHPGDHVSISYIRDGKTYQANVELKNINGTTSLLKNDPGTNLLLGVDLRPATTEEKRKNGISSGVVVTSVKDGLLAQHVRKNFIITSVNDTPVNSGEEIQSILSNSSEVQIGGKYPGINGMHYFGLELDQ